MECLVQEEEAELHPPPVRPESRDKQCSGLHRQLTASMTLKEKYQGIWEFWINTVKELEQTLHSMLHICSQLKGETMSKTPSQQAGNLKSCATQLGTLLTDIHSEAALPHQGVAREADWRRHPAVPQPGEWLSGLRWG